MSIEWVLPGCLAEPRGDRFVTDDHPDQSDGNQCVRQTQDGNASMTLAEFVERKFVPGYVSRMRTAARSYFHAILKYILRPAHITHGYGDAPKSGKETQDISNWPYMNSFSLSEVSPEAIQHLLSVALRRGYSPRTVTHIRDVIRNIFSYAELSGDFAGTNPAIHVIVPAVVQREPRVLSLNELRHVMHFMQYPERTIALFALSADVNVTEISGLQWQYVNLSSGSRPAQGELLPPRTIAIRNQSYRCVFEAVNPRRKRLVPVSELLYGELRHLKGREKFVGPEDFVIASRTGTPISPDNVAWRRLKGIGKSLDMPWLSWKVFHDTRCSLVHQFGRYLNRELEQLIQPNSR